MSESNTDQSRAETLLQRFFDRQLSVDEGEQLLAFWDAHPDWEREAQMNYQVEYPLVFFAEVEKKPLSLLPAALFAVEENEPETINAPETSVSGFPRSAASPKKRRESLRSFMPLKYILPVVALLWVASMYMEFRPLPQGPSPEPPFHALGRIESTAGAVSALSGSPLRRNRRIAHEPMALREGSIEMLLKNNVRLVLEGPGEFQLISEMNAFCSQGRLSIFVPPEATGFEVTTPTMSIHDLGTAFVLDVSPEQSELHVVQGHVEANAQTKEPLTFTAGLGARVDGSGRFVRRPADLSLFVTPEEMRRRAAASLAREHEREQIAAERFRQDPSVVFHLDFEGDWLRRTGTRMVGCRRVPGSRPNNEALLFEKRRDVISCPGTVETDSLTLLATIRIDGLPRTTQTLFTCRDFGRGAVQWQVGRGGILQILVGRGESQSALNFRTRSVIPMGLYGVWIQLAVVLDGETRTITHYLDGEAVARNTMEESVRFRLTDMEVGNWTQDERVPTLRFFNGAIDEIVLFDRSLSQEEINNLRTFD